MVFVVLATISDIKCGKLKEEYFLLVLCNLFKSEVTENNKHPKIEINFWIS